jgi:hypothetical protein
MGMESNVPTPPISENVEANEEAGNEFTVEQRDKDIKEMIEKLSKKNFGLGFNKKKLLPLSAKLLDGIAEKYGLWLDILISPGSKEYASPEDKLMTKRVTDFFEVYDSDITQKALEDYFANKK